MTQYIYLNKDKHFGDFRVLLTRKSSQGILLKYMDLFNVKISSKGRIMVSTLGKKTVLEKKIISDIMLMKKKLQEHIGQFFADQNI